MKNKNQSCFWVPTLEWKDQDAFLIGGGSSLLGFDWTQLKGANTIGCNDAFRIGPDIVKICLFGDASWFQKVKWDLEKFPGRVVTVSPTMIRMNLPWCKKMDRVTTGLGTGSVIGWNYSTGAAAINLAITLGANRVFLLGYDLSLNSQGKSHWHNHRKKATSKESFCRFQRGFKSVFDNLPKFPGVRVINVTDGSSHLPNFERITFEEFAKKR